MVSPAISDELRRECGDLPKLQVEAGTDMRKALLQNRAESEAVLASCKARHAGVLRAVGSNTLQAEKGSNRWAEFTQLLKETK